MDTSKLLANLVDFATLWGVRIIGVLIALWIGGRVAAWLGRLLQQALGSRNFDATLTRFFSNLLRYALLTAVVIGCLGVFGIETTSFAAVLAAAGLAVGLALQGTLGNFAAGVMLLAFRPFKVGDLVKVAGALGTVDSIDLFTSELRSPDNRRLIIPNSEIFGKLIENLNALETRRVDVPVGVSYGADIERTRQVLEAVAPLVKGALVEPPPMVFLKSLSASSVDWEVRVWCNTLDYWAVYQDAIRAIKKAIEGANLSIPFPQLDVHLDERALRALKG